MSAVRFRIFEAIGFGVISPMAFLAFNAVFGNRPLINEFEAGAITAAVGIKCIEALHAYFVFRS